MDVEKPDEPSEVPSAPTAEVQDPCLDAARHLHSLGVPTMSMDLSVNSTGVKTPRGLPLRWVACRLDNCLKEYVKPRNNSLAMITGSASDVYAVDVDLKDNGAAAFQEMLEENGCLPSDTPTEQTGSGGMHLLFLLKESLDAGLISGGSRNKLKWRGQGDRGTEGQRVGIDTRGDAACSIVPRALMLPQTAPGWRTLGWRKSSPTGQTCGPCPSGKSRSSTGKARPPGERDSHELHCIFIHVTRTRPQLSNSSPQISTSCSGCLGFCANFLTASNPVQESIHCRGVVQGVQAFAQTFSRGKKASRWTSPREGGRPCSGCSGFCPNFSTRQKSVKVDVPGDGWPAMFRVFRLLPKLSHKAKKCQGGLFSREGGRVT
jgi:hypothetical protein